MLNKKCSALLVFLLISTRQVLAVGSHEKREREWCEYWCDNFVRLNQLSRWFLLVNQEMWCGVSLSRAKSSWKLRHRGLVCKLCARAVWKGEKTRANMKSKVEVGVESSFDRWTAAISLRSLTLSCTFLEKPYTIYYLNNCAWYFSITIRARDWKATVAASFGWAHFQLLSNALRLPTTIMFEDGKKIELNVSVFA